MRRVNKWKALAFESELIAKDVLKKEFLTEDLFQAYSKQTQRLKSEASKFQDDQCAPIHKNIELIETRLRVLNPEHRIQTNFEFFTRKIYHFQNRLELLKESLSSFQEDYSNLSMHHVKRAVIEKEIALLEGQLVDTMNQRESLLA